MHYIVRHGCGREMGNNESTWSGLISRGSVEAIGLQHNYPAGSESTNSCCMDRACLYDCMEEMLRECIKAYFQ